MIIRFPLLLLFYLFYLVYAISPSGPQQWKRSFTISSPSTSTALPNVTEEPLLFANKSLVHPPSNTTTHRAPLHNTTTRTSTLLRNPTFTHMSQFPGQTAQPSVFRPPDSGGGHKPPRLPSSSGPSIAQIFFEVLGGVAGLVVLLAISRCIYIYKRTPESRRPAPEIREVDRTLALFRTVPFHLLPERPPPPPYQPAPPEYDAATGHRTGEQEPQASDRPPLPPELV